MKCASYVEGEAHWCTYWQDVRLCLAREDTDAGFMILSSKHWLTPWSRRGKKKKPIPTRVQCHLSSSSGRERSHIPPKRPRKAPCRKHREAWGQSWEMRVDLGRKLCFPQVVQTSLRPEVVIWSEEERRIIMIELTVPWEDGCEEVSERKATKY